MNGTFGWKRVILALCTWAYGQKANHEQHGSLKNMKQQHGEPQCTPHKGGKTKVSTHL